MRSIFFIAFLQPSSSPCMQTDYHMGVVLRSHSIIKLRKWSCVLDSTDPTAFFTTKSLPKVLDDPNYTFLITTVSLLMKKKTGAGTYGEMTERGTDTCKYITLMIVFVCYLEDGEQV